MRANAASHLTDPSRLGSFGGSGGAYLAAVMALKGDGALTSGTRLKAFAGWSGPYDCWRFATTTTVPAEYLGCEPYTAGASAECIQKGKDASPVEMASAGDPPSLIRNSTNEVIQIEHARELRDELQTVGVTVDYEEIAGDLHAFALGPAASSDTLAFFAAQL